MTAQTKDVGLNLTTRRAIYNGTTKGDDGRWYHHYTVPDQNSSEDQAGRPPHDVSLDSQGRTQTRPPDNLSTSTPTAEDKSVHTEESLEGDDVTEQNVGSLSTTANKEHLDAKSNLTELQSEEEIEYSAELCTRALQILKSQNGIMAWIRRPHDEQQIAIRRKCEEIKTSAMRKTRDPYSSARNPASFSQHGSVPKEYLEAHGRKHQLMASSLLSARTNQQISTALATSTTIVCDKPYTAALAMNASVPALIPASAPPPQTERVVSIDSVLVSDNFNTVKRDLYDLSCSRVLFSEMTRQVRRGAVVHMASYDRYIELLGLAGCLVGTHLSKIRELCELIKSMRSQCKDDAEFARKHRRQLTARIEALSAQFLAVNEALLTDASVTQKRKIVQEAELKSANQVKESAVKWIREANASLARNSGVLSLALIKPANDFAGKDVNKANFLAQRHAIEKYLEKNDSAVVNAEKEATTASS